MQMPSKSKKQHDFMAAVANNPAFAKKAGVPQSVGQEFVKADKGKSGSRADVQAINKPKTNQGSQELFSRGGEMKESKAMAKKEISFMQKKGAPKSMIKHEKAEYGMAKGGMTKMGAVRTAAPSKDGIAAKGKTKGKMVTMKKGGYC
jgi:hypothetical protein